MRNLTILIAWWLGTFVIVPSGFGQTGTADAAALTRGLSRTPDSATAQAIVSARDAIWHAWFTHDTAALDRLLPEAVAAGEGLGGHQRWADRAQTVTESKQFLTSGESLRKLTFPQTEIRQYGNVAVVFSTYDIELSGHGSPHSTHGRSTEVFVQRDGRWVNPFWRLGPGN